MGGPKARAAHGASIPSKFSAQVPLSKLSAQVPLSKFSKQVLGTNSLSKFSQQVSANKIQ